MCYGKPIGKVLVKLFDHDTCKFWVSVNLILKLFKL